MSAIDNMLEKITEFRDNLDEYIRLEIIEDEAMILDMNSQSQLFEKGITRDGIRIDSYAPYSPRTIQVKLAKSQPTNRVTLRDTGDFQGSFVLIINEDRFFIDATDWKTSKLGEKYGEQIFGLTDENIEELAWEYLYPMLLDKLKSL